MKLTLARLIRLDQGEFKTASDLAKQAGFASVARYQLWESGGASRYLTSDELAAVAELLQVTPQAIATPQGAAILAGRLNLLGDDSQRVAS